MIIIIIIITPAQGGRMTAVTVVNLSIYKPSMVSFLLENERVRSLRRYCVITEVRVSLFLPARAPHRSEDD